MGYGIYLHTPFCATKCPYCDFASGVFPDAAVEPFVDALGREVAARAAAAPAPAARSVFVGGGTPSHLPGPALRRLLGAIRDHLRLEPGAEITVEVNPESLTPDKAALLQDLGVNRVSVGVQSLDDGVLRVLGRPHDAAQALRAATLARARFARVSFDLIVAVPGMTPPLLGATLERLLDLGPDHLSIYDLTFEPGTPFHLARTRGELVEMDDTRSLELDGLVGMRAQAAGLERYEISNYARPGCECRHNLDVWRGGWYLGLGPGAHSCLPAPGTWGRRTANVRDLRAYVSRLRRGDSPIDSEEAVDRRRFIEERLLLGLRLREGIDLIALARTARCRAAVVDMRTVARLAAAGLLERRGARVAATAAGRAVLDAVIVQLAVAIRVPGAPVDQAPIDASRAPIDASPAPIDASRAPIDAPIDAPATSGATGRRP